MNPSSPWTARALQLFAAAAISLILAVQLGLQNPFWAAMPVWVVAQPNRQDLLLRAVLRVLGTAFGAWIGWLVLMSVPGDAARVAVLALGVGLGASVAFWIGTVYSYGVILAAITLAVVASVRHLDTDYDRLLMSGVPRAEARDRIRTAIDRVLDRWRTAAGAPARDRPHEETA